MQAGSLYVWGPWDAELPPALLAGDYRAQHEDDIRAICGATCNAIRRWNVVPGLSYVDYRKVGEDVQEISWKPRFDDEPRHARRICAPVKR